MSRKKEYVAREGIGNIRLRVSAIYFGRDTTPNTPDAHATLITDPLGPNSAETLRREG
jgi:hypothetical protein